MTTSEPEIPSAAVAELLDQLGATTGSDADLVAMLNACHTTGDVPASDTDGAELDELALRLKVDVAGFTAALQTLATLRQMSLADFLSDGDRRQKDLSNDP